MAQRQWAQSTSLQAANNLLRQRRAAHRAETQKRVSGRPYALASTRFPAIKLPKTTTPSLPAPDAAQIGDKTQPDKRHVSIHPRLATAMLTHKVAAAGRVWLLLRALDTHGRGWLPLDSVRAQLSGSDAQWRVCGQRRLRELLRKGDGTFWQRDGRGRLWLHGAGRVAAALAVERIDKRPVQLPIRALLGGMRSVRAQLYATFHSGRSEKAAPIGRGALSRATGVAARTQRLYDKVAGVRAQANWAIGPAWESEGRVERSWHFGRAVFKFTDRAGKMGGKGAVYTAWRLPNSYSGPHAAAPQGRSRKIRRQLQACNIDLVTQRARGNGAALPVNKRLFYRDGQKAGKAWSRESGRGEDAFWRGRTNRAAQLWHLLPGADFRDGK